MASCSQTSYMKEQKSVLRLKTTHFIKGDGLSTGCAQLVGMLSRWTLGDKSETIRFRHPRRQMTSPQLEPTLMDWFLYDSDFL